VGLNASNYSVELSHVSVVTGVQFVTVNHKWFVFVLLELELISLCLLILLLVLFLLKVVSARR